MVSPHRSRHAWAGAAAAVCLALIAASSIAPAAAISSVWTGIGQTAVVTTPDWTLLAPLTSGSGAGVFIKGETIYTFTATDKNKDKPKLYKSGKNAGKTKAASFNFKNLDLTSATVGAGGLVPGSDKAKLSLTFKIKKLAEFKTVTTLSFPLQGTFKYAALYGGASQVNPSLLTPTDGLTITGKPKLTVGSTKTDLTKSGATFQLANAGGVSIVCADGNGGTLGLTGVTPTKSGCQQCPAGTYGKNLEETQACVSCKTLGPASVSTQPGQSQCTNCTGTDVANADATACVSPSGLSCKVNEYKNSAGVCVPCGDSATSIGGSVTTCTCKTTATYNTTTNKCVCPVAGDVYNNVTGCPTAGCVVGQYQDPTTKLCNPCPNGCSACSDGYTCTSCKAGQEKRTTQTNLGESATSDFVWKAVDSPKVGRFLEPVTKQCESCQPNCLSCSTGSDCTQCMTGYFVNQNLACTKCNDTNCATCSSASVCTKCLPGWRLQGSTCVQCNDINCAECSSDGVTCVSCKAGFGPVGTSGGGNCTACGAANGVNGYECGWGSCTGTATTCTKCLPDAFPNDPYYQINGLLKTGSQTCTSCTNKGSLGTGPSSGAFCSTCSSNPDICLTCADKAYLGTDNACRACVSNCDKCSDGSTCTTCSKGYFRDPTTGTCVQCTGLAATSANCETCVEQNKCNACVSGYYLDQATKACVLCPASLNAAECASSTVASRCKSGFFLSGSLCVPCGSGCAICKNNGGSAGDCLACTTAGVYPNPGNPTTC